MENNDKKWKILSSEYLVKRPWLTARRDKVELPDGRVNDEFYVLEYPAWINVIAITEDGRIVMERQYRHALGVTCYEIPAGVVEQGEQPIDAAKRELEEETGYVGGEWSELMVLSANPGLLNNLTYCYLARGVKPNGTRHLDATEDLEVVLMERDKLVELLQSDQLRQALMIAPLYKALYNNLL
ncbi:MAG: NUDIX hydrolase [Bacteroidales bacterium]|nr:NUDIX hydrolase [Bacteroidales bacterium]